MERAILCSRECGVCGVCLYATDVADDGFVVREGDDVAGGNDVVYADECRAVAIGYDGQCVGSDMGDLLDGFGFHVAVSGWRGANIGFPFWRGHEESARGGCSVRTALESSGEVWISCTVVCVFAVPCPYAVGAVTGCRCCDGGRWSRGRLVLAGESRPSVPAVRGICDFLCVVSPRDGRCRLAQ